MTSTEAPALHEPKPSATTYEHRWAFWLGVGSVSAGIFAMLPKYLGASENHYQLAGTGWDTLMTFGMILTLAGVAASMYGLFPRIGRVSQGYVSRIRVRALDDAPITWSHVGLLLTMAAAITIDVMKPTSLAFIAPGIAKEYGLRSALNPHAAGLPVAL